MKKIKQIIQENITKILNEAMMDDFSLKTLSSLSSFKAKKKYCDEKLGKHIGKGSSRIVYQIDDEKVLKLAFNGKGVEQNEMECDTAQYDNWAQAKVFDFDDNYSFLVSEYVIPANKEDFQYILGITFDEYQEFIKFIYNMYARKSVPCRMTLQRFQELMDDSTDKFYLFNEIYQLVRDFELPFGDLIRLKNLGIALREGEPFIVVIDNGVNDEILEKYY